MKRFYFITILLVLAAAGCKKYNKSPDDLGGDFYLRGRVFLLDNEQESGKIKNVDSLTVKIGYTRDSAINYLFATTTDGEGYFLFENLKKNTAYTLFAEDVQDSIKYTARLDTMLTRSIDSSRLILEAAAPGQNGIIYTVTDANGSVIPNCRICGFSSGVVANDSSCAGSTFSLTTNAFGKASTFNIPASPYFVFFKAGFDSLTLKGTDTITYISESQTVRRTITVKK